MANLAITLLTPLNITDFLSQLQFKNCPEVFFRAAKQKIT